MKAITTKYLGPTDRRGSRISKASDGNNSVTIGYPHELSGEAVHRAAAEALKTKMGWSGDLIAGAVKGGYVFVFAPNPRAALIAELRAMGSRSAIETADALEARG